MTYENDMVCDQCGSDKIVYHARRQDYVCEDCGNVVASDRD